MLALFAIAAFLSAVNGFHRPALEAITQKLVARDELAAVSALASLRGTTAAIAGPSLAGLSIAAFGLPITYSIEVATFAVSVAALAAIRAMPPAETARPAGIGTILEGLRYAGSRPELIGTYAVDIVAMTFAMPLAVFPALAEQLGGTATVGFLYSAMSIGALLVTIFSAWTRNVERRGAAVVVAAALWGVAIVGLGFATSLPIAVGCLVLAGAADMVSGLFRMTIWNETIPPALRGRMASIEQLSYMTGPLLGNARAGFMAEQFGLARSIAWGGIICVAGVHCACRRCRNSGAIANRLRATTRRTPSDAASVAAGFRRRRLWAARRQRIKVRIRGRPVFEQSNTCRPSSLARSMNVDTPRTELPIASSRGEKMPMPSCRLTTPQIPPPTPLFAGTPTS